MVTHRRDLRRRLQRGPDPGAADAARARPRRAAAVDQDGGRLPAGEPDAHRHDDGDVLPRRLRADRDVLDEPQLQPPLPQRPRPRRLGRRRRREPDEPDRRPRRRAARGRLARAVAEIEAVGVSSIVSAAQRPALPGRRRTEPATAATRRRRRLRATTRSAARTTGFLDARAASHLQARATRLRAATTTSGSAVASDPTLAIIDAIALAGGGFGAAPASCSTASTRTDTAVRPGDARRHATTAHAARRRPSTVIGVIELGLERAPTAACTSRSRRLTSVFGAAGRPPLLRQDRRRRQQQRGGARDRVGAADDGRAGGVAAQRRSTSRTRPSTASST